MRRLILAAALAAASASFAFAPAYATGALSDDPGVNDLGVDIYGVQLTPAGVHAYMASQTPDTQRAIEGACQTYTAHQTADSPETQAFCADLGHKA
jgi:hypothetical protein